MHNPWRRFNDEWPHIPLTVKPLPGGLRAVTDGRVVWMHDRLLQAERRCAIAHEIVHLERGEHCAQFPAREASTDREAARRLITFDALADSARWAFTWQEAAGELWVTPRVLLARFETLTDAETAVMHSIIGDRRA